MQQTVTQNEVKTQPWRLVHDLRDGRKTQDLRTGDLVLTEAGLHIVRGGDGHRPMRLWYVGGI